MYSFLKNNTEIIISFFALIVSVISIYHSRKNNQSQLLISLIERESIYIDQWNNVPDENDDSDKKWQYINLFETISLFYNNRKIDRKMTKKYFINIFKDVYQKRKEDIEARIIESHDFEELDNILQTWKIKNHN